MIISVTTRGTWIKNWVADRIHIVFTVLTALMKFEMTTVATNWQTVKMLHIVKWANIISDGFFCCPFISKTRPSIPSRTHIAASMKKMYHKKLTSAIVLMLPLRIVRTVILLTGEHHRRILLLKIFNSNWINYHKFELSIANICEQFYMLDSSQVILMKLHSLHCNSHSFSHL